MTKESGFLPLSSYNEARRLTVSEREALIKIFETEPDKYGRLLIPEAVDPIAIIGLYDKGLLSNKGTKFRSADNVVEITKFGKEVIRRIVLSLPSALEKHCSSGCMTKIAHSTTAESNWLTRANGL